MDISIENIYKIIYETEFWAAIIGAIVGGLIALFIQIITLRAAKNQRSTELSNRNTALAQSILFKVMRIHSNFFTIHFHIEEAFSNAEDDRLDQPSSIVLPLASYPSNVNFTSEEMSLILFLNQPELTEIMMSLDEVHNTLLDAIKMYGNLRLELQEKLPADMNGTVGTVNFTKKEWLIIHPKIVTLDNLINNLRSRANYDYLEAEKVSKLLLSNFNTKLDTKLSLAFSKEKIEALAALKSN